MSGKQARFADIYLIKVQSWYFLVFLLWIKIVMCFFFSLRQKNTSFFKKCYQDIISTASILINSKSQLYELNPEFNFKGISIPFTHKGQFSHEDSHSDWKSDV